MQKDLNAVVSPWITSESMEISPSLLGDSDFFCLRPLIPQAKDLVMVKEGVVTCYS